MGRVIPSLKNWVVHVIDFTDISVAIIRRTFRTRFRLASLREVFDIQKTRKETLL